MTWTYTGNPASSTLDEVRFLIGDTDESDQLLSDEEIDYFITTKGSAGQAAPAAAEAIGARFSRQADTSRSVGDLSISKTYSSRARRYYELADRLLASAVAPPIASFNADAIGAEFKVGDMDYLATNPNETTA